MKTYWSMAGMVSWGVVTSEYAGGGLMVDEAVWYRE